MAGVEGRRIVIADNDPEWVALARFDLDLEGHDIVAVCSSGADAIDACRRYAPDVLVVDYRMPPGITGVEVARRVRAEHPEIKVVLFTNYEDELAVDGAAEVGAAYVLKGNLRALREAVTSWP